MTDVIEQLKNLKKEAVKPDQKWLEQNRALLLSQIKNTISEEEQSRFSLENLWMSFSIFLPRSFVHRVVRPVVAAILVFALGAGGWIATVGASQNALPGEWLYPAKIATEKTQVAAAKVIGADKTETKLRVEIAKRRAEETKELVSAADPEKMEKAVGTMEELKKEIKEVGNKLNEAGADEKKNEINAEVVKGVNDEAENIKDILKEVKAGLATVSSTANDNLTQEITEVKGLVKETSIKAVEVLVDKHLQGDDSVSKEDVIQAIDKQVQSAVQEAEEKKNDLAKAEKDVNSAVEEAVKVAGEVVSSTTAVVGTLGRSTEAPASTSTQPVKDIAKIKETAQQVSEQVKEAVTKVAEVSDGVTEKATVAKELISQNNLQEALKVVVEVNKANKEAEETADQAMQALKTVVSAVTPPAPTETPTETPKPDETPTETTSGTAPMATTTATTEPAKPTETDTSAENV